MRLQCCLQNSSAVKGIDGCTLLSNGVKKVVPKRYSELLAGICKEVMIREKVALLVLDAKVVTVARCCSKSAVNRLNSRGFNIQNTSLDYLSR